jgi:GT2 family glycosyltransferase
MKGGGAFASLIIPTCNRPDLLRTCLDAVAVAVGKAQAPLEVIVTDDSKDDASERLMVDYAWAHWIRGPRRGPAANRNNGARMASGRWLFFTDDDCIPDEGWLRAFLDRIASAPDCRVFEGKTVADRERRRMDEESPVNLAGGYLWSCNMAIRRELFDELGGFCESFPYPAMEDVDMRMRLTARGERFPFVDNAVVCHPYRAAKGIKFTVRIGASYLHLAERNPQMLGTALWRTMALTVLRRSWALAKDAVHYRFRGFGYAAAWVSVGCYFDAVARLRAARRGAPRVALANGHR